MHIGGGPLNRTLPLLNATFTFTHPNYEARKPMSASFCQQTQLFSFETEPHSFTLITKDVAAWLDRIAADTGTLTLFVKHTSASLTVQENADPTVRLDLQDALSALAPRDRAYRHHMEGPDDMPGHIKSMLTDTSLTIPVVDGLMDLGTWQGLFLIEHRDQPHTRRIRALFQGVAVRQ